MAQEAPTKSAPSTIPANIRADELQRLFDEGKLNVEDVLRRLQVKEALAAAVKKEAELDQRARAQTAMLQSIAEGEAMRAAGQENCPHRKENGRTALAGQQVSNGQIVLICLHCQKEFRDFAKVPEHLRPAPDLIGG